MQTAPFQTIVWQDNTVVMLNQRLLPEKEEYVTLTDYRQVAGAIKDMTIRGAPAIGVAAAMGAALGALNLKADTVADFKAQMSGVFETLSATRPTAVNLTWALGRMKKVLEGVANKPLPQIKHALVQEAQKICEEDIQTNRLLGRHGQVLLDSGDTVLTHCNAGALATAGYGTALGVIYAAVEADKKIRVYADETRPVLQGARLTAWELAKHGIPVTVITDGMAATLMRQKKIHKVIVGADRIAANGDTANKIGTYTVAISAKYHGIPFYVAAPLSTVDLSMASGDEIPIEQRNQDEVSRINGKSILPQGVSVENPAFDVTPAELISGIVTEKGVFARPFDVAFRRAFRASAP